MARLTLDASMAGPQGVVERAPWERVIHASVVGACLVPVLHAAACTRFGYEQSQFFPAAGPGEWKPALECGELDRAIDAVLMGVDIGTFVLAVLVLVSVAFRGARWRLFASVLYGPVLVYIGIKGLLYADLHRWLWGTVSLVAGAVLTSFVGSYWLYRPRDGAGRRASSVVVFGAGRSRWHSPRSICPHIPPITCSRRAPWDGRITALNGSGIPTNEFRATSARRARAAVTARRRTTTTIEQPAVISNVVTAGTA